jgi:hypothetical protein
VPDLAAFEALPATLVLRRWLMVSRGRAPTGPLLERVMLGEVFEGPDLAHVVFRERWVLDTNVPAALQRGDSTRVLSVRRTPSGWRVGLGGGLLFDESGGFGIGYDPGKIDPTEGEDAFRPSAA